jgi:amino acid adenylation domain-containing protein
MIEQQADIAAGPAPTTLSELLDIRARGLADRPAFTFLQRNGSKIMTLSYRELLNRANAVGAAMAAAGVRPGDRVVIACSYPSEFVPAFFGAVRAGAIPVPTPAPTSRQARRFIGIVADCQPAAAFVTSDEGRAVLERATQHCGREIRALNPISVPDGPLLEPARSEPAQPAFLQYTSGSTGAPRGVIITHRAALANSTMIQRAFGHDAHSRFVGWLPLFHDMGLVGNVLQPLFVGAESVLMPAVAFLEDPLRWLLAISTYRAHTSGGPDFAYRICAEAAARAPADLDLRSWRVAFNGSESVRASTLEAFSRAFERHGFRGDSFLPCYGMAETTLLATGAASTAGPRCMEFSRDALEKGSGQVGNSNLSQARRLVSSGPPTEGGTVAIVSPASGEQLPEGHIGEIWIAGEHVARHYWGVDGDTTRALACCPNRRFHASGDLGFLLDGEIFVLGRLKELVIVEGRNLYPHDIEETARRAHPAISNMRGAVFSFEPHVMTGISGEGRVEDREHVVLIQEIDHRQSDTVREEAIQAIRAAVAVEHDLNLDVIFLVRRGGIEVTSSGKIRRAHLRHQLLGGQLAPLRSWIRNRASDDLDRAVTALRGAVRPVVHRDTLACCLAGVCNALCGSQDAQDSATFGSIGMSSLMTLQLIQLVESATGTRVPFVEAYGHRSIRELAEYIAYEASRTEATVPASGEQPSLAAASAVGALDVGGDLSNAARSVLLSRLDIGDQPLTLGFTVWCDDAAAEQTLQSMRDNIARHPELNVRYVDSPAGLEPVPTQLVVPLVDHFVSQDNVSFESLLARELDRPFDLDAGPVRLFRVRGVRKRTATTVLLHHVASDFHSVALLADTVAGAPGKPATARPESPHASKLPGGTALVADLDYWRKTLRGFKSVALAPDFPDSPSDPPNVAPLEITAADLATLRTEHGVTVFCLMVTGLHLALAQLTGAYDLTVLAPFSVRRPGEDDARIGYYVRPVPLRINTSGSMSFRETVRAVSEAIGAAALHSGISLPEIMATQHAAASRRAEPIQTAAIHFESPYGLPASLAALALGSRRDTIRYGDLELSNEVALVRRPEQPLELMSCERDGKVSAVLRTNGTYSPAAARSLAAGIAKALALGARRPDDAADALAAISLSEMELLAQWSQGPALQAEQPTLIQMVARQSELLGDAVALVAGARRVSYRELMATSHLMAGRLSHAAGQHAFKRIGILVDDPIERTVAMLAGLQAGAAIVPLDVELPPRRLEDLLRCAGVDLLLTDCSDRFDRNQPSAAGVRLAWTDGPAQMSGRVAAVDGRSPAYVVFTSGSTGFPKTILHSHASMARFVTWQAAALGLGPGARMAQIAAPGFDVSLCETFGALCVGATLCLPVRGRDLAPGRLFDWLEQDGVTVAQAVPAMLAAALAQVPRPTLRLACLASVGEPLPVRLARQLFDCSGGGMRLLNLYGPSEVIAATAHEVTPGDLRRCRIPIGRPLANRIISIRDADGGLTPLGRVGEIWISTTDMSQGYERAPPAARSRFVELPDWAQGRAGTYRSGDVGRWLSEGRLEIVGRLDNQLKVRGVRIEPEEIEGVLATHAAVQACVVSVFERDGESAELGALIVATPGTDPAVLRQHCAARLPHTHVPALFRLCESIPLLSNGKLDRVQAASLLRCSPPPPRNAMLLRATSDAEARIMDIWRQHLQAAELHVDSNLFELGGHSIMALQILNHVQDEFGISLKIGEFLSAPTIHALSSTVDRIRGRTQ